MKKNKIIVIIIFVFLIITSIYFLSNNIADESFNYRKLKNNYNIKMTNYQNEKLEINNYLENNLKSNFKKLNVDCFTTNIWMAYYIDTGEIISKHLLLVNESFFYNKYLLINVTTNDIYTYSVMSNKDNILSKIKNVFFKESHYYKFDHISNGLIFKYNKVNNELKFYDNLADKLNLSQIITVNY
jgi:hypothetical protein